MNCRHFECPKFNVFHYRQTPSCVEKFGKGIQFHGAPDHIEVPDPEHQLTSKHITLLCWVKLSDDTGTHAIMEQYD
ncbi:hypothetical protein H8E77_28030 [bacterium]|nr:hypothetical protein [bacterium]